jgi:predicted NAD/FAD-binding protein
VRIAIVGTGVSGLVAAHSLHVDHDVTVYEADGRVGGHAHTVDVEVGGIRHAVDTGFIVYNEANYPGFTRLLRELDVETQPTEMSFSVTDAASGLEYRGSNLNTLFAQRRNLRRPSFLRLLSEIVRFNRAARRLVMNEARWQGADRLPGPGGDDDRSDESIELFLRRGRYSRSFVEQFLVPFGSAIWSADPSTFTRFPMRSYARFMHNHGLLGLPGRTQWRTISGGSREYIDRLAAPFADRIRLGTAVHKVVADPTDRAASPVELLTDLGPERFDRVIIAAHSDQALEMLADPSPQERAVLGSISYQPNTATLHTDARLLPNSRHAGASWNYSIDPGSRHATVTYWMNALQAITSEQPILLTLNRSEAIDPTLVLAEFEYRHPVFDLAAIGAQQRRREIQGVRGIYFVGAYWGYGFHEDGVQSALEVARAIRDER